jgi:hypothetical protein
MIKTTIFFVSALLLPVALTAQTTNSQDLFAGTWKLNVGKSKFDPRSMPYKSMTTTAETNGKTTTEIVMPDGHSLTMTYTVINGTTVPVEGPAEKPSTLLRTIKGNVIDDVWTRGIGIAHGHGVLSKDGKTLRYTNKGISHLGQKFRDVDIFERQ